MLRPWFQWVNDFPSAIAIRESVNGYPALLTVHVVSMCLFAGLIIMMDLRLLGVGNLGTSVSQIQKRLFPWQMLGMTVSSISGLVLVYAQPMRFYGNIFFWIKAVMMVLAGANALAFHFSTYHSVAAWDSKAVMPFGAKLAGALSIVLWASVVVCGRLIAYNWFNPV
jgi:Family of unknown function (DUF6644)